MSQPRQFGDALAPLVRWVEHRRALPAQTAASLVYVLGGGWLYVSHDVSFSREGLGFMLLNMAAAVLERILQRRMIAVEPIDVSKTGMMLLNNACVIMLSSMLCLPNNFSNPDSAGLFFTSKTAHTVTRAEAAVKAEPSAKADKGPLAMLGSSLRGEVNKVRDLGSPVCLANVSHLTTWATYCLLCSCWCQRCPCNRTSAPCR